MLDRNRDKSFTGSWIEQSIDDVAVAAYLVKHGQLPIEIVPMDKSHSNFVFQNTPEVERLLDEWKHSGERSFYIHYRELLSEAFKAQKLEFGGGR